MPVHISLSVSVSVADAEAADALLASFKPVIDAAREQHPSLVANGNKTDTTAVKL